MQKNILCKTVTSWDYIIITVNNYKQKEFAKKEILKRRKLKYISKETKVIIRVAPKGFETGRTLIKILKNLKLNGKKALYIPSAGKAQRTLYYFKKGKLWITTEGRLKNGENKTIFDEILENTKPILMKMSDGILICCSDVVIKFNGEIDLKERDKVYVFSSDVDRGLGTKHGVFKIKNNQVEKVCQKGSLELLEKEGFINNGNVNIDTGMMLIPNNVIENLKNMEIRNKEIGIYENLIPMFCKKNMLNAVLLNEARFIHYGSSLEIIKLKGDNNKNYFENSKCDWHEIPNNVIVFNSRIDRKIPNNVIIYTTKLKNSKWVTIILGINDDIKAKGENIRLFDENITKRLEINKNSQMSLWNLKIYKASKTKQEALINALELYDFIKNDNAFINLKNALSIEQILKKEI